MSLPNLASMTEWLRGEGEAPDVVLSSRVRLARNLASLPFMPRSTRSQREQVLGACHAAIRSANLASAMAWTDLHTASPFERTLLVERHLISQQLGKGKKVGVDNGGSKPAAAGEGAGASIEGGEGVGTATGAVAADEPRAVAFSVPDERLSIMVNEEDHLRVQVIRSGLALGTAMTEAHAADDKLEGLLEFAYSPRFGYLTACPTNVGTGMRLSVMLHLPALKMTGNLEKVERAAKDMSLAVRGFYGEGSQAIGDVFQLSNQTTLGKPEGVLLQELEKEIMPRVIDYERAARRSLLSKRRGETEDQVCRALGTLRHARLMGTEESMQLLSLVRMGVVAGLVEGLDVRRVNECMLLTQPAHLQRLAGQEIDQDGRRHLRATMLRERLRG